MSAPVEAPVHELLVAVGRRLRLAWGVATAALVLPVAFGLAVALVAVARLRPWAWPEAAAVVVVGVVLATVGVAAAVLRVPLPVAARAADRGLATGDAFATALELDDTSGPLAAVVRARARVLAVGRRAADVVHPHVGRRRLMVLGALAAAAVGLALAPNPQDSVRRRLAAEQALLEQEAVQVREDADALRTELGPPAGAVAARLDTLAGELERATDLETARAALARAAAELGAGVQPGFLAQKAAVRGLAAGLEASPLTAGVEGSAAEQLARAGEALPGLSPEELAALAERLAALAATQTEGNPALGSALAEAAAALSAGDVSAATAALGEAAGLQDGAAASVSSQEAAAAGLATVGSSTARLADGGQGQGQGQGQGGQGQGGQGQGSGGASGQVGGTNAPTGSGQGGQGNARGSGDNPSVGLQESPTVYEPQLGAGSEQVPAGGRPGEGRTETVGKGSGATRAGPALVPLADVLPRYEAEATKSLDRLAIPPSQRVLVRAYFDALAGRR